MTEQNKPTIIDGVDVSNGKLKVENRKCVIDNTGLCVCAHRPCKQLQRMKTERNNFKKKYQKERAKRIELEKRLNEQAEIFKQSEQEGSKIISELEQENARLKEEKDFWCKKSGEFEDFLDNITNKEDRYKQALEEIRDYSKNIAETNTMTNCALIYEKTNEVLNDRT